MDVDEEVEYSELARRCKLPVDDLRRLLRSAMARHVFKEPRKGYVAHNAASRIFLQSPLLNSFLYSALDEIWPAAAHMLDAMDKWKDSQEPHESVRFLPGKRRHNSCSNGANRGLILLKTRATHFSEACLEILTEKRHLRTP